jgi:hypothetical protein
MQDHMVKSLLRLCGFMDTVKAKLWLTGPVAQANFILSRNSHWKST